MATASTPRSRQASATPTACGTCVATGADPETIRSLGSLKWEGMLRPPLLMSSARERPFAHAVEHALALADGPRQEHLVVHVQELLSTQPHGAGDFLYGDH